MEAEPSAWPEDDAAMRAAALGFDLKRLERRFLDNPYPLYRALRQHDPVHRMPDGSFFLTRYDDCVAVYRDAATWSSDKKIDFRPNFGTSALYEHHTTSLVFNDPPYHTRVRRLLAPAFTPRALKALQPRVEALIDRLLDALAARGKFELFHNCIFLLNAGHETTTNLIGNGIDLLVRHPDALAELRREPVLIQSAVEEFLRMESSNQLGNRRAAKDTVLSDIVIPAGAYVHIGIGAANRDP